MFSKYKAEAQERMNKNLEAYKDRLRKTRTGRAQASLLDSIKVTYYGASTSLSQMSSISTPDARTIVVSPWESSALKDIEQALVKANLGITPQNDGKVIRLSIPNLTEERRKELVKDIRKEAEKCRVDLRTSRRMINDEVKKLKEDKEISEDDQKKIGADIQKITDDYINQIEELLKNKEKEILEI